MGCEYAIRLDPSSSPISSDALEEILRRVRYYHGKTQGIDETVFEFRGPDTKSELNGLPDVNVGVSGHDVIVCQFADYDIAALVLGVLVMELVSVSKFERIEVVKP